MHSLTIHILWFSSLIALGKKLFNGQVVLLLMLLYLSPLLTYPVTASVLYLISFNRFCDLMISNTLITLIT